MGVRTSSDGEQYWFDDEANQSTSPYLTATDGEQARNPNWDGRPQRLSIPAWATKAGLKPVYAQQDDKGYMDAGHLSDYFTDGKDIYTSQGNPSAPGGQLDPAIGAMRIAPLANQNELQTSLLSNFSPNGSQDALGAFLSGGGGVMALASLFGAGALSNFGGALGAGTGAGEAGLSAIYNTGVGGFGAPLSAYQAALPISAGIDAGAAGLAGSLTGMAGSAFPYSTAANLGDLGTGAAQVGAEVADLAGQLGSAPPTMPYEPQIPNFQSPTYTPPVDPAFTGSGMSTIGQTAQNAAAPFVGQGATGAAGSGLQGLTGPMSTTVGATSAAAGGGFAAGGLTGAGTIGTNALGQAIDAAGNVVGSMNDPSLLDRFRNMINTNWTPNAPGNIGSTATGSAGRESAISRILNNKGGMEDYLSVGGNLGTGLLSAYASNQQSNSLQGIADTNRAERAPFLQKATQYLNSPESYAAGPGQAALKGTLAGLSVQGNPFGSGTALQFATDTGNKNWLGAVNTLGNLGLGGQGIQANLDSQAVGANKNMWQALGATGENIFNPQPSGSNIFNTAQSGAQSLAALQKLLGVG